MKTLYNSFVISFLNENHPAILNEINKNYQNDLGEIKDLAKRFCEYHAISIEDIQEIRIGKLLNLRYKFIGCVLYLFQPAKINSNEQLNKFIAKELKDITKLNADNLNKSVKCACNLFMYKEWKADIIHFCTHYKLTKK